MKQEASSLVFYNIHEISVRGFVAGVKNIKRKLPMNTVKAYEEVKYSSSHS
jgi:hypothetical protein